MRNHYNTPFRITVGLVTLATAASLFVTTAGGAPGPQSDQQPRPSSAQEPAWVEATLGSMTVDEKVGQLIIPATVGMFLSQDSEPFKEIKRNIIEFHVGGYHVLGDTARLHDPAGVAVLINHMQGLARVPLMITADFEGGVGYRYVGATRLPRAMAIGATGNDDFAYQAGRIAGEEARAIGVGINFYPVVDVNNNARNPIINIR